jgi:U3 small nucleolar RNA-associated protein 7
MPSCGPVGALMFRPFEDLCGIGHAKGFSSVIIIPGSGEPNLDTSENLTNPHARRQAARRSRGTNIIG